MSVPLYMDQHVKGAVTAGLRKRGVDVVTCVENGTDQSDDDQILARAHPTREGVFTQDDDFLARSIRASTSKFAYHVLHRTNHTRIREQP